VDGPQELRVVLVSLFVPRLSLLDLPDVAPLTSPCLDLFLSVTHSSSLRELNHLRPVLRRPHT
jgi:hypothetical protein